MVQKVDGETVQADDFWGFSGGTPADSKYHWDDTPNASAPQPSVFDMRKMFMSPVSGFDLNYCSAINFVTQSCTAAMVEGPDQTLAYPGLSPNGGTYNLTQYQGQINAGVIIGSQNTWISQQQLDENANRSYCVATYGRGWRLPTDIEMGHTTNSHGWGAGIDPSYNTKNTPQDYHLWSSARYLPSPTGHMFILWPSGTQQNGYWDGNTVNATNQRVRCVYPPN